MDKADDYSWSQISKTKFGGQGLGMQVTIWFSQNASYYQLPKDLQSLQ